MSQNSFRSYGNWRDLTRCGWATSMSARGHQATKERCRDRVRSTSISGNKFARLLRRVSAISGREQTQQTALLFDHLVGALLEKQRHVQSERLGSLEIDHQLKLDWGLDGKHARLLALEDAIDI
jgi:hypothetical protein